MMKSSIKRLILPFLAIENNYTFETDKHFRLSVSVDKICRNSKILLLADLAQLVEQRTRNA